MISFMNAAGRGAYEIMAFHKQCLTVSDFDFLQFMQWYHAAG